MAAKTIPTQPITLSGVAGIPDGTRLVIASAYRPHASQTERDAGITDARKRDGLPKYNQSKLVGLWYLGSHVVAWDVVDRTDRDGQDWISKPREDGRRQPTADQCWYVLAVRDAIDAQAPQFKAAWKTYARTLLDVPAPEPKKPARVAVTFAPIAGVAGVSYGFDPTERKNGPVKTAPGPELTNYVHPTIVPLPAYVIPPSPVVRSLGVDTTPEQDMAQSRLAALESKLDRLIAVLTANATNGAVKEPAF